MSVRKSEAIRTGRTGKRGSGDDSLIDRIPISKVNYILYVLVLVAAVFVVYWAVMQYLMYVGQLPREDLYANVTVNDVQTFGDAFHPYLVVETAVKKRSMITVTLTGEDYSSTHNSGEYSHNYTALVILPTDKFSTDIDIHISAVDKKGRSFAEMLTLTTAEMPEVLFKVS